MLAGKWGKLAPAGSFDPMTAAPTAVKDKAFGLASRSLTASSRRKNVPIRAGKRSYWLE